MKPRKDPDAWRVPTKPVTSWRMVTHGRAKCLLQYGAAAVGEPGSIEIFSAPHPPIGELFVFGLESAAGTITIQQAEVEAVSKQGAAYHIALSRPAKWWNQELSTAILVSPLDDDGSSLDSVMQTSLLFSPASKSDEEEEAEAYKQSATDHLKAVVREFSHSCARSRMHRMQVCPASSPRPHL